MFVSSTSNYLHIQKHLKGSKSLFFGLVLSFHSHWFDDPIKLAPMMSFLLIENNLAIFIRAASVTKLDLKYMQ